MSHSLSILNIWLNNSSRVYLGERLEWWYGNRAYRRSFNSNARKLGVQLWEPGSRHRNKTYQIRSQDYWVSWFVRMIMMFICFAPRYILGFCRMLCRGTFWYAGTVLKHTRRFICQKMASLLSLMRNDSYWNTSPDTLDNASWNSLCEYPIKYPGDGWSDLRFCSLNLSIWLIFTAMHINISTIYFNRGSQECCHSWWQEMDYLK